MLRYKKDLKDEIAKLKKEKEVFRNNILRQYLSDIVKAGQAKKEYSGLGQIDMLSGTGNQLQEKINRLHGKIEALKWVLEL